MHTVSISSVYMKITTNFQRAEVQNVGTLPPLHSKWSYNTTYIFIVHFIFFVYYAVSVFLTIDFL